MTEDADLGIRAAAEGLTVGVLDSTTFEEANGDARKWVCQRSRWIFLATPPILALFVVTLAVDASVLARFFPGGVLAVALGNLVLGNSMMVFVSMMGVFDWAPAVAVVGR